MALTAGVVGLPNVGKSTLFNAITQAGASSANYPFCTIDPNVGVIEVPDQRLQQLAALVNPQRIVATSVQITDIAGLVKGASRGEGLGNQFLSHIREVDAILHVVRCFADENISHVAGKIDPADDIETINLELVLADLQTVERRLEHVARQKKSGDAVAQSEHGLLLRVQTMLEQGKPIRSMELSEEERSMIQGLHLLTLKNILYVANVSEEDIAHADDHPSVQIVKQIAAAEGAGVITISAQVESEIAELDGHEREIFIQELGLQQSGVDRLIAATYHLLGLITYFTAGEKEVRAWTVRRESKAPQAAGVIHTDFERGFIRAEVIGCEDLLACGSIAEARDRGLLRLEGKEYIVQDGDVIHFRFHV